MDFLGTTSLGLLRAVPVTVLLFLASALGASLVAAVLVAMQQARVTQGLARAWIFVFRGTPLLLQIFMVYYGIAALGPIRHGWLWPAFREPLFCAWLAMTCFADS